MADVAADMIAMIGIFGIVFLIVLAIAIFFTVCLWKIFEKMGEPGWKSIVPFYSNWVLCEHTWGNGAMMFAWMIPYVGSIMAIITYWKMFERFGKSTLFNVFAIFFSPIAIAICAFDNSEYTNPEIV